MAFLLGSSGSSSCSLQVRFVTTKIVASSEHDGRKLMDIFGVTYMSRAAQSMSPEELDRLLLAARTNNAATDVTGVLLYGDGRFFQYFEGGSADVAQVYARIRDSKMHQDMVELEYRQIPQRLFRKWFMGFREAPASILQKLSHEQWSRERPWVEDQSTASAGMQELLKFLDHDGGQEPMAR